MRDLPRFPGIVKDFELPTRSPFGGRCPKSEHPCAFLMITSDHRPVAREREEHREKGEEWVILWSSSNFDFILAVRGLPKKGTELT